MHLDICPVGTTQADEMIRLVALAARRVDVDQGNDVSWVVMEDPLGDEFCVMRTLLPPEPTPFHHISKT